ncbi:MAG: hypothetical protein ACRYFX_05710 [Janthinobacterium lividum]
MLAGELPTVGYLDPWFRVLLAEIQAARQAAPAPAEVVLYSVAGLAEVLACDPSTVRRWLREGKPVQQRVGSKLETVTVKLQAYYFSSEARIPWPALQAYERGEDFDLATLPAPTAAPPKPLPAPPERPEVPHLRLAS